MSLLTHERFEILADAYGGEVARWPIADRDAAALLMAAEPAYAQGVLAAAGRLDAALDAWPAAPVAAVLRERLIASAPQGRVRPGLRPWLWRAGLGASLAGACAAGLLVGVGLSPEPQAADPVATVMSSYDGGSTLGDV